MADERYRWLDRETAERLLSGEPLEAVDATAREQVGQLAETLGALSRAAPLTCDELPGEAAALAAFRKARAERAAGPAPAGGHDAPAAAVRPGRRGPGGRRRWGRPARFGLAAALAAGMLGGVAVAAGTGALPLPFRSDEPEPAVSVPDETEPLVSPSPDGSSHHDGRAGSPDGDGPGEDAARGSAALGEGAAEQARRIAAACRDVRDGEALAAERRSALESAAGGAAKVAKYCESVLSGSGGGPAGEEEGRGGEQDDAGAGAGTGGGSAASGGRGTRPGGDQGQEQDQQPEQDADEDEPGGSGEPGDSREEEDASDSRDAAGTAGRGTAGRGTGGKGDTTAEDDAAPRSAHLAPEPTGSAQPAES